MNRLPLVLAVHDDETPASFVSRLAGLNGTDACGLCLDFGLDFRKVVNGDPKTLRAVAELGGADPEILLANAFFGLGDRRWTYRGERLPRDLLRIRLPVVCPLCARADIANAPSLPPEVAVYGRVAWRLEPIWTCLRHRTPLVGIAFDVRRESPNDFSRDLGEVLGGLLSSAEFVTQVPTAFETYLVSRLSGATASPLLDTIPLVRTVQLVEVAGAVDLWGPNVKTRFLTDAQRREAAGRGFDAIAAGREAFRSFLKHLHDKRAQHRQDGPGAVFGRLSHLINDTKNRPDLAELRKIEQHYVAENFVLPDRKLAGPRKLHSIRSLAKLAGVHPKSLRKHLRAAGLITDEQMALPDHNVRVDAAEGERVAREAAGHLSRTAAMKYVGAPLTQMDVLVSSGFLKPRTELARFNGYDVYATADLDDFLRRLASGAAPLKKADRGFRTIPDAAQHALCSSADVVRMVLAGKLATRTLPGKPQYMTVLVDGEAVKDQVRGPAPDGLSLRLAVRVLGTSERVLEALIKHGYLPSIIAKNPVNKALQTIVTYAELEKFQATYVSLWNLSKERGIHVVALLEQLERASVKPAFDHEKVGARFYTTSSIGVFIASASIATSSRK